MVNALFRLLSAPQLAAVIVALAVVASGFMVYIYEKGARSERANLENQNREAGTAAIEADLRFRNCRDAGGVFHFDTGKCSGGASSRRDDDPRNER